MYNRHIGHTHSIPVVTYACSIYIIYIQHSCQIPVRKACLENCLSSNRKRFQSHSTVPGGFDVISYVTLLIPATSFVILEEICLRTGPGKSNQSAVMKSSVCTALKAITCSSEKQWNDISIYARIVRKRGGL